MPDSPDLTEVIESREIVIFREPYDKARDHTMVVTTEESEVITEWMILLPDGEWLNLSKPGGFEARPFGTHYSQKHHGADVTTFRTQDAVVAAIGILRKAAAELGVRDYLPEAYTRRIVRLFETPTPADAVNDQFAVPLTVVME